MHLKQGLVTGAAYVRMGVTTITTALVAGQTKTSRSSSPTRTPPASRPTCDLHRRQHASRGRGRSRRVHRRNAGADQPDGGACRPGDEGRGNRLSYGIEYEPGNSYEEIVALARKPPHTRAIFRPRQYPTPDRQHALGRRRDHPSWQGCRLPRPDLSFGAHGLRREPESLAAIAAARANGQDITADTYPYDAWATGIKTLHLR